MSKDIFISYRSLDEDIVKTVLDSFRENNISYWYAPEDIKAGGNHDEVIIPAIKAAKIFIIFLSKNNWPRKGYEKDISTWVRAELLTAIDFNHLYIIPIKIDDTVDEPVVNLAYKSLPNYFDLTKNSLDTSTKTLSAWVKELLTNDKYKDDYQDNFREVFKKVQLEIIKDIEKNIKDRYFQRAEELIFNNKSLKERTFRYEIQLFEIIIRLSKKPIKDMDIEELIIITSILRDLRNSEFKNISFYLEAMIAQSYFEFNRIRNDITDSYNILKQFSKDESIIKQRHILLMKHIVSSDEKFRINWLR